MTRLARFWLGLALLTGCADTNALPPDPVELLVVTNSQSNSVSIVPVDPAEATVAVSLGGPRGTPTSVAGFDRYVMVPLADVDQVAIVDLQQRTLRTRIPLPSGARPAGAIMLNDSIGYVANPGRNSISWINALSQHLAEIPVGVSPQGFAFARGRLFVLNANLDSTGEPVGASWLTVINPGTNALAPGIDSVPLTGPGYAAYAAVAGDGLIYIVNRGRSTTAEGRLSVVDPLERKEVASFAGLGLQPGPVASDGGARVFVSSQTEGLLEFNTDSNAVVRGEGEGVPITINTGVAVDNGGQVYAIEAGDCDRPGFVHVLDEQLVQVRMVQVGRCPAGAQVVRMGAAAEGMP